MIGLGRTVAVTLRRIKSLEQKTIVFPTRKSYSSETPSENEKTFVRIGNVTREIKSPSAPEKVPRGYLSLYAGALGSSQSNLKGLRWLMQKDALKQDAFLIGSPPGAFRRHLALAYAELTQREVEYLCLTRDTTESDIKQRREVLNSSVIYVDQCAVSAAIHGRILLIEGIEKAERNLLPILNNLLENRELNLDDGRFLVSPDRFEKLSALAPSDLQKLNLLKVHEDFRVIAIGLPVPKYKGTKFKFSINVKIAISINFNSKF